MSHPILELEAQVARVLAEMEVVGVFVDNALLIRLERELMDTIQKIETDIAHTT